VPISVTVLGAAQLQALRVNSGTEIARQTPNLRLSNLCNEDQPKFSLRGISTPDFNLRV
jgi:iron complex outermembrane receptor protein